jgi:hypothetical protein
MNDWVLSAEELTDIYCALMETAADYSERGIKRDERQRYESTAAKLWPKIYKEAEQRGIVRRDYKYYGQTTQRT